MRISNRSASDRLLLHIQTATTRLNETQERLASGRRINRVSDDPFAAARTLASRTRLDTTIQRLRTVDLATTELAATESSLVALNEALTRVQDLAVQADSAAIDASGRQQIAIEVEQLIGEVLSIANTSYGGRRIFGGHQSGAPFAPDVPANPTAFTFGGDSGQVLREIGNGEHVAVNLDGEALFDGVFESLIAFRDGLRTNDRTAINAAAADIGHEIDNVLTARGDVGARMRRLELAGARLDADQFALKTEIAGLEEIDITAEVVELEMRNTAFQAALSATGRSLSVSLMDFLR